MGNFKRDVILINCEWIIDPEQVKACGEVIEKVLEKRHSKFEKEQYLKALKIVMDYELKYGKESSND